MNPCTSTDCDEPQVARLLCRAHYGRLYRAGEIGRPYDGTARHRLTQVDREQRSAECSICGPVPLSIRRGSGGETRVACMLKRRAERAKENRPHGRSGGPRTPVTAEDRRLRRLNSYGLTPADYDMLLEEQGGVCAICGQSETTMGRPLAIDHDHASGKVRGLLCGRCNLALGALGDTVERLAIAVEYLARASG